ncbi:MAG: hypothetical protein H0Z39_00690 [Peptococcaceae bacterium]|nr:hypothetical protein [Peptococcaceae bacterium]
MSGLPVIKGRVKIDRRTKNLIKRLEALDIAVIAHEGIDKLGAEGLIKARPKAIINVYSSLSKDYPNSGPGMILRAGIPIIDEVGPALMEQIKENDTVEIINGQIFHKGVLVGRGVRLTMELVRQGNEEARARMDEVLAKFVENTLDYARQEINLVSDRYLKIPEVKTRFRGRHALVVVRGENYREDLQVIQSYIREMKPVLIGVDGGADALREFGFKPDIVIGDMDSVSDRTLREAKEIIVHAYSNGKAPGLERIKKLGLSAAIFAAPGTSEDIAMLLAFDKGAELIVAVGTHSNMLDFLEKGRKGMASTFLTRLKVGSILVDAKGVSQLYRRPLQPKHVAQLVLAALLPLAAVMSLAPATREILHLLYIQIRVLLGI